RQLEFHPSPQLELEEAMELVLQPPKPQQQLLSVPPHDPSLAPCRRQPSSRSRSRGGCPLLSLQPSPPCQPHHALAPSLAQNNRKQSSQLLATGLALLALSSQSR